MNHLLGNPIATGGTAEIYDWKPGWILKLHFERYGPDIADYEHDTAVAICATGLPIPSVGEVVRINNRVGLLYEKLNGEPMSEVLSRHLWRIVFYTLNLAELHAAMHATPMQADISPLRQKLEYKIRDAKPLPEKLRTAALKALEGMPDCDRLCHGDFHPGNILLGQQGPIIIDWIDSSIGSPLADVARTSILLLGMAAHSPTEFPGWVICLMHSLYLLRYFQLRPSGKDKYHRWLPIVAAARLNEGIVEWESWLIEQAS